MNAKFLFFTGKGGVGKTSLACAEAVKLADEGNKVLLISTDPASNLEDVLGAAVGVEIAPHPALPLLFTVNIDPEVAADEYRERAIQPIQNIASLLEINKIKEGLSGACTTEIASFDEFSRFITGEAEMEDFDFVIFDTAPTGHTIRLLELPAAWDDFLEDNPEGAACIGPSSALKSSKERYKKVIESLRDPQQTTFYLVARAEKAALKEAARTSAELAELGLRNQALLINGIFKAIAANDPVAQKIAAMAQSQLTQIPAILSALPQTQYPLLPYNILGLEKLRSVYDQHLQAAIIAAESSAELSTMTNLDGLRELVADLSQSRNSGLIMTMGKGGVGKTIVAAAIATLLAEQGHQVLLTTTDPAAHIHDFIQQLDKIPANLTVERIDPKVETQTYMAKIMQQRGANLNEEARKLLAEDLKSPCTEEVAVFHAFSKAISKAKRQFVVIDTAPTGHTLLLLDTTGSYHREILKNTQLEASRITTPYMALQDGEFAKILLVALPETTPMREAAALQADLQRAGIEPFAWVVNQCLSELPALKDPILQKRAHNELAVIAQIQEHLAKRSYGVPYIAEEQLLPSLLNGLREKTVQV